MITHPIVKPNRESRMRIRDDPYEPIRHRLLDEEMEAVQSWEVEGLAFKDEVWRFYPEQGIGGLMGIKTSMFELFVGWERVQAKLMRKSLATDEGELVERVVAEYEEPAL